MSINEFLDTARAALDKKPSDARLVLVTGNDSADLDSIISALLMAYLSQKKNGSSNTIYIPLIKVPFCDLALRPEVTYVFEQAGIDTTKLICIDQLDTSYLESIGNDTLMARPDIILVDHNRLTPPLSHLEQHCQIVGVVDHHVDEGFYLDAPLRWIEVVGSCTSQVVLLLHDEINSLSDVNKKAVATLAAAPILVDTIGLCWNLGKTTQKDVDALKIVGPLAFTSSLTAASTTKSDGPDGTNSYLTPQAITYYNDIEHIKSQVDHLSTRDLLRKDYKQWTINGYTVGTSSMSWYLKAWVDRDGYDQIVKDAWAFIGEQQLDMLVVLTSYDHSKQQSDGVYERELAFFVANDKLLQVKNALNDQQDVGMTSLLPLWGKENVDDQGGRIGFYNQKISSYLGNKFGL
ncbi:hypothetical protein BCR42DRAFT_90769 [Absidia repens]|uniref:DHHA2 domain-containing protein n=1 Tax=Absidia repens TaxID=90262 RepID=A0A1X2IYN8_9FUNG|nr:hypothetical protein BCR42DRAFT_90769 [Absidia repens]